MHYTSLREWYEMRQYLCECSVCKNQYTLYFEGEPFPVLGDSFPRQCLNCGTETPFQRVATRKARRELRAIEEERALRTEIREECGRRGFACEFLYQSVVIRTPAAHWKFDDHTAGKTLWHESTYRVNLETGLPAVRHKQFEGKKLSWREVIAYIDHHDQWRAAQKEREANSRT